jgi:chromosome segregation ATPase
MAMTPERESNAPLIPPHFQCRNYTGAIVTISMLIACLFAANLYTLDKLNSARLEEGDLRSSLGKQIWEVKAQNRELLLEYSLLKASHTQQMAELTSELDHAATQLGTSTGQVLDRARTMVGTLEKLQARRVEVLQEQIGQKADAQDLAGLKGTISGSESELGTTQRTLNLLAQDLGVARSQLGELAANSDDQRQTLQQFTGAEYHQFTLEKNHPVRVEQIRLRLRKTNTRDQSFSLDVVANDQEIRNRDHSVFEPIIFYVTEVRLPYQIVITTVGSDKVSGYVRVPNSSDRQETQPRT